jgi:hypothetical protein
LRIVLKPWLFMTLLALCVSAIVFELDYYRHRFVRSNADMVALLPPGNATTFFIDVTALRRAGVLGLFAESKAVEETEYREFVRQTHFDYRRDIQAIAGAADGNEILFIIRGRFDWSNLHGYALAHGGACKGSSCDLPTSKPGRWVSFLPIQSDVMGLALGKDRSAAHALSPHGHRILQDIPSPPVWVRVSRHLLQNPLSLPVPVRIFFISLQFADRVVLSLDSGAKRGAEFTLELDAECPSRASAETIKTQLELQTRILRTELAREHQQPSPADFTGLLVSGTFQVSETRVIGMWPIHNELLKALQ